MRRGEVPVFFARRKRCKAGFRKLAPRSGLCAVEERCLQSGNRVGEGESKLLDALQTHGQVAFRLFDGTNRRRCSGFEVPGSGKETRSFEHGIVSGAMVGRTKVVNAAG